MKNDISRICLRDTASIKDALEVLNSASGKIIFLCDLNNKVVGSITDGDIRRTLLRGEPMSAPALKAARKDFTWATKKTKSSEILRKMQSLGIRQVPILDEQMRLLDVRYFDEFVRSDNPQFDFPAVIMAGGRGVRLRPYTDKVPKPLLRVGDRALIERCIVDLREQGIHEFFVTVNYLANQIIEHLGDGEKFGCKIQYIHERDDRPLGTAGSLSLLKEHISTPFLVINGDVLSTLDVPMFAQFHQQNDAIATICSKIFTVNIPYGVVRAEKNDLLCIDEKPDFSMMINAGIYFFSPEVLEFLNDQEALDMPDLLRRLMEQKKKVKCFQSSEPWIDIGSHADFERVQKSIEFFSRQT